MAGAEMRERRKVFFSVFGLIITVRDVCLGYRECAGLTEGGSFLKCTGRSLRASVLLQR